MGMRKHRKRPQAQKQNRHANPEMAAAMRELRQGSRTQPHRLRNREERTEVRRMRQRGWVVE